MKQHITIEQLNELNDDHKSKLKEFFKERDDVLLCNGEEKQYKNEISPGDWCWESGSFPLPNIGQMIEFLSKNTNCKASDLENHTEGVRGYINKVAFGKINSPVIICWKEEELCDALWKAIKEVLKK